MRNTITLFLALFVLFPLGCATKYQKHGFTGGYKDFQLQEDVFRVTAKGNAFTSDDRAVNYVVYRSAEITVKHGYDYFVILEASDGSSSSYSTNTFGNAYTSRNSSYSTTSGTFSSTTSEVKRPKKNLVIKLFKGKKPKNNPNAYNAKELMSYLEKEDKGIEKSKKGSLWQRLKKKLKK